MTTFKPFIAALMLTCLAQAPLANAAFLSLQPDSNTVSNGDSLSLDIIVSGLGDFGADSLGAFDFSIGYDTSALSFTGYSLGSLLGDLGTLEAIDGSSGDNGFAVNLAEVSLLSSLSLDALQPTEFILASISFDVLDLAIGATTELALLGGAILGDSGGSSLPFTSGGPAAIEGVSSVPLPGTLLLFVSGLLGLSAQRRSQRSRT
ncbi:MAG: hypothetical protein ACI9JM_000871 [Halioglobus sp.]